MAVAVQVPAIQPRPVLFVTRKRKGTVAIQVALVVIIGLIVGILTSLILFSITQQVLQTIKITQPQLNATATSFLNSLSTVGNFIPLIALATIGIVVIGIILAYLAPYLYPQGSR